MHSDPQWAAFDRFNIEMVSLMMNGQWNDAGTEALFDMTLEEAIGLWTALIAQYCTLIAGIARSRGETPLETWQKYLLAVATDAG